MISIKPTIGITLGDYNGIGPEVILKALSKKIIYQTCIPILYGPLQVWIYYQKKLQINTKLVSINTIKDAQSGQINILTYHTKPVPIQPGLLSIIAAQHAYEALKKALQDIQKGLLHAIVTGPIHKKNMGLSGFSFPGHTEFFQYHYNLQNCLMLMIAGSLRVGVITGHIPLCDVAQYIVTHKHIVKKKINLLYTTLQNNFGIANPKIALIGLNPHAGEEGLVGTEEIKILQPIINSYQKKGIPVSGPYAADGFWGNQLYQQFDAILAMYHDQGLMPFKILAFEQGVNFTAGLPIIRTSPAHGTAFSIAGKNIANPSSMAEAIHLAISLTKK